MFFCQASGQGVLFKIHLSPRSSREKIGGVHGDALKVWVTAPPVEGKANEALLRLLAGRLGVPVQDLEIKAGRQSRMKTVYASGLAPQDVLIRLTGP